MHTLQAGVLSMKYKNGFIRQIKYGDLEVVRMIYMALRNQNWETYEPIIENEKIVRQPDSFQIQYDCFYELQGKRIFHWKVEISGNPESKVTFEIQGTALTDVLKNRAGLCILHPIKFTAGQPCELLHTDGTEVKKIFPVLISAENPFKNMKGFRWRCHDDWFALHFEGDTFETEDQRNWSDTSYKTFCTPLEKPFPVQLKAGDKVHQKVYFQAAYDLLATPITNNAAIEIVALEKKSKLPGIGIAASTETDVLSDENRQAIIALKLNHYRIEVQPSLPSWIEKFRLDCKHAEALKLPLEIALHLTAQTELQDFYQTCAKVKPVIQKIILLSVNYPTTNQALINEVDSLRKLLPNIQIGAGTNYNFRELNCNPFHAEPLDFISYSIDPQEHATDDLTIIENMEAQADTVRSARAFYPESKAIHISPLTLKKRFNPAATIPKEKILSNTQKADPRQQTSFGAVFTLGSIKSLSLADTNAVTLYQTIGQQGILSAAGKKYPIYDVLKEILTADKFYVVHTLSNQPLLCDALLLTDDQSLKLILANYSSQTQQVIFRNNKYSLEPLEIRVATFVKW